MKLKSSDNRWLRGTVWVLFAAIMYLILGEAAWAWVHLPILGNIGFTLIFVLFALTHCAALEGLERTAAFFAISAVVSYALEEIGVRTGQIYGTYHYGDSLGMKLGHVPIIIPLAWFMMIYPSFMVAKALLQGIEARSFGGVTAQAVVAAWVMTAWDLAMDPGMAAGGVWTWENGGDYFGVPLRNYVGWLFTTFLVYWIMGLLWRRGKTSPGSHPTRTFEALPVIVYSFFAVRYMTPGRIPALQVIALFSMGFAALVALIRLAMTEAPIDRN